MQKRQRLYYEDAYRKEFAANVTEVFNAGQRCAAVLDQTYFYPTSGGQPHDVGRINEIPVIDVSLRLQDGAVLHWLADKEVTRGPATAVIDWPRRFDHMQQHSGQHILSQAFIRTADANTVSFHLSADAVTIDLDKSEISPEQLQAAEQLANQIVWENRPIHVRFVTPAAARQMALRQIPVAQNDLLRIVEIDNFDQTACGGTHVAHTGAVGLIKIVKQERIRGQVRIGFCCGRRALDDYGHKHAVVTDLMSQLTTGSGELLPAVLRLQTEVKETGRRLQRTTAELMALEAESLRAAGTRIYELTVVTAVFTDRDAGQLRLMSRHLTQQPQVIALLGLAGAKSFLLFARSEDRQEDMRTLIQPPLAALGGRGGGTAVTAQGGGPAAAPAVVEQAINLAVQSLHNDVK